MSLHLVIDNTAPQPLECQDCGSHSMNRTLTGILHQSEKLIFDNSAMVASDFITCACCGVSVAYLAENGEWHKIKKSPWGPGAHQTKGIV